jgi:hypothetical protein
LLPQILLTVAPAVAVFFLVGVMWDFVSTLAIYGRHILVGIALLSVLPLIIQLVRRARTSGGRPVHPAGVMLPLAVLSLPLLWPAGERFAREIPALCEVVAGEEVGTAPPALHGPHAIFSVQPHGWGNPRGFEFSYAVVVYTGHRRFDDLHVRLSEWEAHFTNSYTTRFPLTRGALLEYVRRTDDFSPADADRIADRLWEVLRRYAEKRDLPPMRYGFSDEPAPKVVYYVPPWGVYLGTVAVVFPFLLLLAWLLAVWYSRLRWPAGRRAVR